MTEPPGRQALIGMYEYYVLDVIGHLPEEERRKFFDRAPELAERFSDWKDVIRFFFPNSEQMEAEMRSMWKEWSESAQEHDIETTAEEFARQIVLKNFVPHIDRAARKVTTWPGKESGNGEGEAEAED